jgi:hypothetical protein
VAQLSLRNANWTELDHNWIHYWELTFSVLNLQILLPVSYLCIYIAVIFSFQLCVFLIAGKLRGVLLCTFDTDSMIE